jgi:hypothetical protein
MQMLFCPVKEISPPPREEFSGQITKKSWRVKVASPRLEKRFGSIAVEKGFITIDQLASAMNIQILENVEKKKHRLIGEILLDLGFITEPQIDQVVKSLVKNPY